MAGIHVLLVDDDDLMLRILEPALADLATTPRVTSVSTALDPDSALGAIDLAPSGPLVVVSDFNLKASLNGVDVLREAARRRPESVRILISGYAADQIGDVTAGGLIHGFLEKPIRIRELYAPLASLIQESLPRPQA
jgi:DNA-binding NtrC family response regulator